MTKLNIFSFFVKLKVKNRKRNGRQNFLKTKSAPNQRKWLNGIGIFHQNNMERKAKLRPLLINEILSHLKKKLNY